MPDLYLHSMPGSDSSDGGTRTLRERVRAFDALIDRVQGDHAPLVSGRRLVKIVDLGSMPTEVDSMFAAYAVELDGEESEGATYSLSPDANTILFVDVLGVVPSADDLLVAYAIGGRWVAEKRGGGTTPPELDCLWFCVTRGGMVCTGGAFPGARLLATTVNGEVTALKMASGLTGCTANPTITIDPPQVSGTTATATAKVGGVTAIAPTGSVGTITVNSPVLSITITDGGSGYVTPPAATIAAPSGPGVRATAQAFITGGVVTSILIADGGSGYTSAPVVTVHAPPSGSGGTTATADAVVYVGGFGYTAPPSVTIDPPDIAGGIQATATTTLIGDVVSSVTVTNSGSGYSFVPFVNFGAGTGIWQAVGTATLLPSGGSGYVTPPVVTIAPPSGLAIPGAGTAVLTAGKVTSITRIPATTIYITAPAVTIDPPGGAGTTATANPVFTGSQVTGFAITNQGSGYTTVPEVYIDIPNIGGTQATADAILTGGVVTGFTITDKGSLYTMHNPIVEIDPPGGAGLTAMAIATASVGIVTDITITNPGSNYVDSIPIPFSFTCTVVLGSITIGPVTLVYLGGGSNCMPLGSRGCGCFWGGLSSFTAIPQCGPSFDVAVSICLMCQDNQWQIHVVNLDGRLSGTAPPFCIEHGNGSATNQFIFAVFAPACTSRPYSHTINIPSVGTAGSTDGAGIFWEEAGGGTGTGVPPVPVTITFAEV